MNDSASGTTLVWSGDLHKADPGLSSFVMSLSIGPEGIIKKNWLNSVTGDAAPVWASAVNKDSELESARSDGEN